MRNILSTILIATLTATPASAQKSQGNFTYFLPKTEVRVALLVEKSTFKPGQLADYTELYFKSKAENKPRETYRIVGMSFSTSGVPDKEKQFDITVDKKHSILTVDCDRNGVLTAINAKGKTTMAPKPFVPARKTAPLNANDYMSQDILSSGNLPKMARLVAQEIYDIRDSRNQLARGEAEFMPKDGEQLKIMLKQLDTQERALLQVFEGTTVTDTTETVVTFVPEKETPKQLLFRFSRHFGLTDTDDLSGAPYYAVVTDENMTAEPPAVNEEAKKQKDDLIMGVNLPGKIKISITDGKQTLGCMDTFAGQFGQVEMLNGSLFGKKMTSQLVLDPVTGNVVSLRTEPLE